MFPQNAWYVACTPDEIGGKPLDRTICGESMVFYRGPQQQVVALEDYCPHRGAPLSRGMVCEGNLICGYHGLEMGCDGKTIAMPGQRVRGFPAVRAFPVIEWPRAINSSGRWSSEWRSFRWGHMLKLASPKSGRPNGGLCVA